MANSIKMIRATICVILVVRGKVMVPKIPKAVDAVIAERDQDGLVRILEQLSPEKRSEE